MTLFLGREGGAGVEALLHPVLTGVSSIYGLASERFACVEISKEKTMARIHVSSVVPAPIESVWEYVHDFNALPKWFPGVTDSHIEPGVAVNQPGCVRNFGLENGARIREHLLAISAQDHSWHYKMIECPLPIANYRATVRFSSDQAGGTLAEITSEFDVAEAQEKEMVGLLTGIYTGAFEMVKKQFSRG
jgi:ligand-binding SRPBCC domain-containing protein